MQGKGRKAEGPCPFVPVRIYCHYFSRRMLGKPDIHLLIPHQKNWLWWQFQFWQTRRHSNWTTNWAQRCFCAGRQTFPRIIHRTHPSSLNHIIIFITILTSPAVLCLHWLKLYNSHELESPLPLTLLALLPSTYPLCHPSTMTSARFLVKSVLSHCPCNCAIDLLPPDKTQIAPPS